MPLAIFDLDNTLIGGDSDYSWGCFLADNGIVDAEQYRESNTRFYDQYVKGSLDMDEYLRFSLQPLKENSMADLLHWRTEFIQSIIKPMILPKAIELVENHRAQQHKLLIITATNRFLTEPIAKRFGIEDLLAVEPEIVNNRFTGEISGIPSFREGKISRLNIWLSEKDETLDESWFYSDSHNDIPLLELVSHPVAVDPDPTLANYANLKNWKQISLR